MPSLPIYDFARLYDPFFGWTLSGLRALAARVAQPNMGMKALDVGCGTGAQLAIYQARGCEVFGVDLSNSMLNIAQGKLGFEANLQQCDAEYLPFGDGIFDLVHSSLFLHQLNAQDRSAVLSEAMRVMRPGGNLLLVDFHPGGGKTLKGRLSKSLISTLEFLAGWEHYCHSRQFLSQGGIPALVEYQHLQMRKEVVVGNGNMGVYLLQLIG